MSTQNITTTETLTGSSASTVVKSINGRSIQDDASIHGLSASGTTITYTKGDGTTGTITTQDTTYTLPTASETALGGIKIGDGLTITDGVVSASGGATVTIKTWAEGDIV